MLKALCPSKMMNTQGSPAMPLGLPNQGWLVSREKGLKPTEVDEHTGDPTISHEMYKQEGKMALNTLNTLQNSGTVIIRNVLCENSSRFQCQGFKVILQTVKQVPLVSNSMFKLLYSCNFPHTDKVINYHCS